MCFFALVDKVVAPVVYKLTRPLMILISALVSFLFLVPRQGAATDRWFNVQAILLDQSVR